MKKIANIFLVISSGMIFTGILFKNMHWPGASVSLLLGSNLSLLGMLFYFIARYRDKNNVKVATYSVYFYFFVMVVGTGYYSAIAASKDLLNGFHDVNAQMEKSNRNLKSLLSNTSDSEGMKLYNIIESDKLMLISRGEVSESRDLIEEYCDGNGIPLSKDNQDISAWYFLINNGGENGARLEDGLKELRLSYIATLGEDHPYLIDEVSNNKQQYGFPEPWINDLCEHIPMIAVLPKLTLIQSQILHCELAMQK
jgi:hypothetical protein